MDIVRIIENICIAKGYEFHYGNKSHLNLIDQNGDLAPDKVHLLLFPPTRKQLSFDDSSRVFIGNFAFVMPDLFAQDYYNNTNSSESENKYLTKIEPLLVEINDLEVEISNCNNIDVIQFDNIDMIDYLDANLSGLWVTYQFKVYE